MKRTAKIENLIKSMVPSLTGNQRKVAEFFLGNLNVVALLPIKTIALQANVSEASIVRFAQTLGYQGYKELKNELSASLQTQLSPSQKYQATLDGLENTSEALNRVTKNALSNINATIHDLEPQTLAEIADRIIKARRIYCFGVEISSIFARLLTFLLRLYTYESHHLSLDFLPFQEQIATLSKQDLLVAFSFSPYSRETIETLSLADRLNIPSIVFTDRRTAPATQFANIAVFIQTDNIMFSNSLSAVAVVINAIITELNIRDRTRTLEALNLIENTIEDERYFIKPERNHRNPRMP